jgi:drug/metabolite transporter (DMT)-like permease
MRHLLAAVVSALMFCAASSGIIMLNKWIISVLGFRFPMTLSLIGMLFSFACSATIAYTTSWVPRTVEMTPRFYLLRAAPIGVLTALTLYFGNLAYVDLSVSFLQMLKASTPLIVLVLMFLARLETPTWSMVGSVLVIAAGTVVAAKGEVKFVWSGVLAMTASQFTEASKLVLMQLLLQGIRLGPLEGLLCFSPFASAALLLGVAVLELPGLRAEGFALMAEHPLVFVGQAALGFCVNLLTILTVKLTSSISFKLISMAKNAAIVLISVPVFHNKISPTQAPPAATSPDVAPPRRGASLQRRGSFRNAASRCSPPPPPSPRRSATR